MVLAATMVAQHIAFGRRFGAKLDFLEFINAGVWLRSYMDDIEDYWERGDGSDPPKGGPSFVISISPSVAAPSSRWSAAAARARPR